MNATLKRKLAIGTTVLAAAAFAGGAYAATKVSGANDRQAFLNDVAKRLNVTPTQLKSALQGAFLDQLQAAVKAGDLTQAQADAIKKRVQHIGAAPFGLAGVAPFRGFFFFHGGPGRPNGGPPFLPGPGGGRLSAAASYLGLTETQLLDQLQAGKSLAQIASSRGKSVSGLKDAMTTAIKAKLDKLVAAKVLTSAQEAQVLSTLSSRLDAEINATGFRMHGPFGRRFQGGMRAYPAPPNGKYPAYPVPPSATPLPGQPVY